MLFLPLFNIVARWFGQSILWIDPLVRHLVFLSAFMGGVLATGKGNHIKLDLVSRALEGLHKKRLKKIVDTLAALASIVACYFLFVAGRDFALVEFEYGKEAFLGIHSGFLVSIIPFGFCFIALRFFTVTFKELGKES
ncbi:MAG: TRAP transporter small permease [Bacteriovoracaceae bacterium]|nr:TRAP transporter small permease [Bacteriovoracaceae bacterium]